MKVEQVAAICHETNRAYCELIGDLSQPRWLDAPDWQVTSAINGVQFHLDNPMAGPQASHENWLAEKERDGWVYGPVKDPVKREHPCFRPFSELPANQQAKDRLFKAIVDALRLDVQ